MYTNNNRCKQAYTNVPNESEDLLRVHTALVSDVAGLPTGRTFLWGAGLSLRTFRSPGKLIKQVLR